MGLLQYISASKTLLDFVFVACGPLCTILLYDTTDCSTVVLIILLGGREDAPDANARINMMVYLYSTYASPIYVEKLARYKTVITALAKKLRTGNMA